MKALDTNVLIRYLVADDMDMASRAFRLFKTVPISGEPFLITTPVLLETLWVLRSKYRLSRPDICNAIFKLAGMVEVRFENPGLVKNFLREAQSTNFDLADLLIALHAREHGATTMLTFDRKASHSPFFDEIP